MSEEVLKRWPISFSCEGYAGATVHVQATVDEYFRGEVLIARDVGGKSVVRAFYAFDKRYPIDCATADLGADAKAGDDPAKIKINPATRIVFPITPPGSVFLEVFFKESGKFAATLFGYKYKYIPVEVLQAFAAHDANRDRMLAEGREQLETLNQALAGEHERKDVPA